MQLLTPWQKFKHYFYGLAWLCLFASFNTAAAQSEEFTTKTAHIAVILPAQAKALATAAEAIRLGINAAQQQFSEGNTLEVRFYPHDGTSQSFLASYQQAVAAGAVGIIGPLTRNNIAELEKHAELNLPILALNRLDTSPPRNLYYIGLSIDSEAQQIAQIMHAEACVRPAVLESKATLAPRMAENFVNYWQQWHSESVLHYFTDNDTLMTLQTQLHAEQVDCIFLAADVRQARLIRPYIGNEWPIYGTSQLWNGRYGAMSGNTDLIGIKFIDIPWLIDPYHPGYQQLRQDRQLMPTDWERLYALGIDAYRLMVLRLITTDDSAINVQGVTGALHLGADVFRRELSIGQIGQLAPTPETDPNENVEILPLNTP